ncbi:YSIRK-type signal peptide-containing protein, partial [Streptococcus hyointestinalis]|uniref:mucin-binding protein n=1 Tax=Streptococcus hyointestinalis TaxID=1337 RepID=UPI00351106B4
MFYKGKHKQRFSIRKYSFGAASVLLGAVIVGAAAPAVNADETQSNALPSVQVESQNTDSATVAVENEAEQATVATKDAGESMESSDQLANDETAVETPTTSASEVAEKSSEAVADESEVSSDKVENTTSEVSDSTVSSTVSGSSSALSESTEKERQIVTTTLENFTALPAKVKAQYQARLSSALTPTEIEGILAEARKQNTLRQVTFGNQGQPIPTGTSLRANTTTGATVVDDNANSNSVTLTHGDNSTRNVNISIPTIIGDKVTVEVPYIFSASTDRDLTGGIYDVSISSASASPEYVTSKSGSTQTFEYTVNTTASVEFNVKLVPTVADWSFLKPGAQYHVVVKRNGIEVGGVDYTIAQQPATVEKVNINFDQNQSANGNLVKGHKYAVGINLQNNGINDGDNFAGTVVVNVPAGFKLDTDSNSGFGFVSTTPTGDTTAGFNTLSNGTNLTVTQEGGAGTPVTITFNKSKTDLNTGNLIFWGTYENNLSGADNNFSATVTYYSTNTDGERSKEADLVATGNLAVGLPVSATEKSALELSFKANTGNIYTDNGTADGTHQSDDLTYEYGDTRKLQVYNSGNVTQTNVKVHVDVEPGTVLGGGEGQYNLSFTTSSENVLGAVSVTLTDGTVVNLRTSSTLGPHNVNNTFLLIGDSAIAKGVAKDGSNIKSIDFTYAEIQAGSKVELVFSKNAILSSVKNTATADYSYTVTSDQGANETGSMSLPIVDPNAKQVQFTGVIEDFAKTSYQPTSTDGGNLAQITYNFRNSINGTTSTTPTSYFVSVPRGFDLVDVNDLALYQYGKAYTDGTIEDLGYIGVNGERMLKVSLPTTPSYQAPIYLKSAKGHDTPVQLIANEDQLPANYIYRGSAFNTPKDMSLIMAINDDKIYTSNYAWDMREITLKDGSTHNVVLSTRGWYPNSEEANYSFTYPSAYGQLNGIKTEDDGKYSLAYNVAKPTDNIVSNNYSDNNNVTDTTGTIRLVNILTDRSTSAYSYNVINLPNVADGDAVTITVTGAGTVETTGDSGNGTLLFSTSKLDNTDGEISASDIANYVTADQVTDWSAIKSILLKSDQLVPSASAAGMVPYKVTAMADGVTNTTLDLQSYFTGDHSGVVYNTSQINKLNIQRYVDVTTNWVDGEGKPLKASTTVTVKSGDAYSTSGLTPTEIPAGYHLKENPVNAVGTTDSSNVVVTYVYEPDVTTKAVTKTVTQIVTYQGAGTATPADHVETVTFTGVETLNTVTGESTTQWNESSATFADVKTPVVTGYVADIATVTGETVTPESGDVTKVVTYKTVGKLIPIDETGVPIPNVPTPSYDNDP